MKNLLARILIGLLAGCGAIALAGALAIAMTGLSARHAPSDLEALLARQARHWLIPRKARQADNPVQRTPEVLDGAMRHWADHCATCHGNDGRGDTSMGRGLHPRAPDMTLAATQDLSDGELFWIIENGIRFTGMPGWGDPSPEDDAESWELVHFIRRLPRLSKSEIEAMKRLNPVSREELEIERFLSGGDKAEAPRGSEHHH